jgi:hypothetical protein
MDQTQLLLEYLKEQYTQARQHETRQTNATTFLTAAAGVLLGIAFKEGALRSETWWVGLLIFLVGLANLVINEAHYAGNRFHTAVAGRTRRALEEAITTWTVDRPSEIRREILEKHGLKGPDVAIGQKVYSALRFVPIGVMVVGVVIAAATWLLSKS